MKKMETVDMLIRKKCIEELEKMYKQQNIYMDPVAESKYLSEAYAKMLCKGVLKNENAS